MLRFSARTASRAPAVAVRWYGKALSALGTSAQPEQRQEDKLKHEHIDNYDDDDDLKRRHKFQEQFLRASSGTIYT